MSPLQAILTAPKPYSLTGKRFREFALPKRHSRGSGNPSLHMDSRLRGSDTVVLSRNIFAFQIADPIWTIVKGAKMPAERFGFLGETSQLAIPDGAKRRPGIHERRRLLGFRLSRE